jgi:hypothetical protein
MDIIKGLRPPAGMAKRVGITFAILLADTGEKPLEIVTYGR